MLEPPHTEENYLLKEMGYRIARKHRVRLRAIARIAAFALPALLTLFALIASAGTAAIAAAPVSQRDQKTRMVRSSKQAFCQRRRARVGRPSVS